MFKSKETWDIERKVVGLEWCDCFVGGGGIVRCFGLGDEGDGGSSWRHEVEDATRMVTWTGA